MVGGVLKFFLQSRKENRSIELTVAFYVEKTKSERMVRFAIFLGTDLISLNPKPATFMKKTAILQNRLAANQLRYSREKAF